MFIFKNLNKKKKKKFLSNLYYFITTVFLYLILNGDIILIDSFLFHYILSLYMI